MDTSFSISVDRILEKGFEFSDIMGAVYEGCMSNKQVLNILKARKCKVTIINDQIPKFENIGSEYVQMKINTEGVYDEVQVSEETEVATNSVKVLKIIDIVEIFMSFKPKPKYYEFDPPVIINPSNRPKPKFLIPNSPQKSPLVSYQFPPAPDSYQTSKRYTLYLSEKTLPKPPALKKTLLSSPELSNQLPIDSALQPNPSSPQLPLSLCISHQRTDSKISLKSEPDDTLAQDPKIFYFELLSSYRIFQSFDSSNFEDFSYKDPVSLSSEAIKRLKTEFILLNSDWPCSSESSIFLMYDCDDIGKIRVVLSGSSGTAYAHGLFLFEVRIPENYPNKPPMLRLRTNENGFFRLNPNFDPTGQVLLSILNTGSGTGKWDPLSCTILQVLLLVQALVMRDKEVQIGLGFERLNESSAEKFECQMEVRYWTLKYAIVGVYKDPPKGFEKIGMLHMILKKEEIVETALGWVESCSGHQNWGMDKGINLEMQEILRSSNVQIFQRCLYELSEMYEDV